MKIRHALLVMVLVAATTTMVGCSSTDTQDSGTSGWHPHHF